MTAFSVVIPTRGDVDLTEIVASYDGFDCEVLVMDNSARPVDFAVYARYALIADAQHDLIITQDDDCVLPPESINSLVSYGEHAGYALVANMPEPFRAHYSDSCLVGFGAVFHRDVPAAAFAKMTGPPSNFYRVADVFFTALTPHQFWLDLPYENLPWASAPNRMWMQPEHVPERAAALQQARGMR